ncbi:MAG: TonB family protein [Terriglobales bacterium]
MGYTAVLFCSDEKVARVVGQTLSEAGFIVDPVLQSLLMVKKLVAQHYDAIVLDCDNIEHGSLLLRSARSSSVNQESLVIALAEGQGGIANAYRIGANLVLTKPINIEQTKATLRVARGLLRKSAASAIGDAAAASSESFSLPAEGPRMLNGHSFSDVPRLNAHAIENQLPDAPLLDSDVLDKDGRDRHAPGNHALDSQALVEPAGTPAIAPRLFAVPAANVVPADVVPASSALQGATAMPATAKTAMTETGAAESFEEAKVAMPWARVGPDPDSEELEDTSRGVVEAGHSFAAVAPVLAKEQPKAEPKPRPDLESKKESNEKIVSKSIPRAPFLEPESSSENGEEKRVHPDEDFPERKAAPSGESFAGITGKAAEPRVASRKAVLIATAAMVMISAGYLGWSEFGSAGFGWTKGGATIGTMFGSVLGRSGSTVASTSDSASGSIRKDLNQSGQPISADAVRGTNRHAALRMEQPTDSGSNSLAPTSTSNRARSQPAQANRVRTLALTQPAVPAAAQVQPRQSGHPDPVPNDFEKPTALSLKKRDLAIQNSGSQSEAMQPTALPVASASNPVITEPKTQTDDAAPPVLSPAVSLSPDRNSLNGLLSSPASISTPTLARIRLSQGVSGGLLIKRVQPTYPAGARGAHVEGTVQIRARIDKEGRVVDPTVLTGDRMLAGAALAAVRQWRYKPYYLNGAPVEVETEIAIKFKGE